jgi:hypothetical protein
MWNIDCQTKFPDFFQVFLLYCFFFAKLEFLSHVEYSENGNFATIKVQWIHFAVGQKCIKVANWNRVNCRLSQITPQKTEIVSFSFFCWSFHKMRPGQPDIWKLNAASIGTLIYCCWYWTLFREYTWLKKSSKFIWLMIVYTIIRCVSVCCCQRMRMIFCNFI